MSLLYGKILQEYINFIKICTWLRNAQVVSTGKGWLANTGLVLSPIASPISLPSAV